MKAFNDYVEQIEENGNTILYNFYNGVSIKYPNSLFETEKEFINNKDIHELLKDEKFLKRDFQLEVEDRTLQLILLVHEDCNFRCTYCYEKFQKGAMSEKVAFNVLNFIRKELENHREDYDKIRLSWFGGEPLLNIKLIEFLGKEVLELAQKYHLEYEADITTNGYLLNTRAFKKLVDIKVTSFQITIDGTKEYHDKQRVLKNGHGTYDRIINNLLKIKNNIPENT